MDQANEASPSADIQLDAAALRRLTIRVGDDAYVFKVPKARTFIRTAAQLVAISSITRRLSGAGRLSSLDCAVPQCWHSIQSHGGKRCHAGL